jgi:hypothetical protein
VAAFNLKMQEKFPFWDFVMVAHATLLADWSRQRNARASPWFATARRADTDSRR